MHVLVLGATSYIGSYLIPSLGAAGHQVTLVGRSEAAATVALGRRPDWLEFRTIDDLERGERPRCDVVVNLAYIKQAAPHLVRRATAELMAKVHKAVGIVKAQHLMHASTIAVFGNPASRVATQLPHGIGSDQYSEGKVQAERMLLRMSRSGDYRLSIVRLGNVIGPASPLWVAGLAQRLIATLPLGWTTGFGPSNATDVRNVVDYFTTLLEAPDDELRNLGTFHHLTEFADRSWEELVSLLERITGVDRILVAEDPPGSRRDQVARQLRSIARGPAGATVRLLAQWLPLGQTASERVALAMKALDSPWAHLQRSNVAPGDRGLYNVMSRSVPIAQVTIRGWVPPTRFEAALSETEDWLVASGFALTS